MADSARRPLILPGRATARRPTVKPHSLPKPSSVYETFWRFAAERQRIFFAKLKGYQPPYTDDPVLQRYRFTNAYRAADRVSQYLIREVLYRRQNDAADVVFRALLFRTFNRIETWKHLTEIFGEISYRDFDVNRYSSELDKVYARGQRIYSSAYVMPSGFNTFGFARKHRNHLALIDQMMREGLADKLTLASSLREVYELFSSFPMMGPFLAFQFSIDINYGTVVNFSEMDFVVAGPGARSGIRKCFIDTGTYSEADIIRYVTERQEEETQRLGIRFESLWGRRLQLIDVQNLFCEVDKYARAAHPEIQGIGARTRIKRLYVPTADRVEYWFPPKWNLNQRIAADCRAAA